MDRTRSVSSPTLASKDSASTTQSTSPHRSAVAASAMSAARASRFARPTPACRATRHMPMPGMMPSLTAVIPNRASSRATRRSQARAIWRPPPIQCEWMAAMTTGSRVSSLRSAVSQFWKNVIPVSPRESAVMSMPLQNARPAPRTMTTRRSLLTARSSTMVFRSRAHCSSAQFRTCGRLSITVATRSTTVEYIVSSCTRPP